MYWVTSSLIFVNSTWQLGNDSAHPNPHYLPSVISFSCRSDTLLMRLGVLTDDNKQKQR